MTYHRYVPPLFQTIRTCALVCVLVLSSPSQAMQAGAALPTIVIDHDDVVITQSCRLVVPEGVYIADTNNNGVVQIVTDNILVQCVAGQAELTADPIAENWDTKTGIGFVIDNAKNVTLRNARAHRYKVGILAINADGLVLDTCDVSGGYAKRLLSTPEQEDASDWLFPHKNDNNEWVTQHGAGIAIRSSSDVTVRGCYARRRQNGLVLDRVTHARIYDNDFSFLSGWGIAMWRSSNNILARNATDFCVRGYSHGAYNRGQDSAGILMFEQCNDNIIAENSATHSGDGLFAFAGNEALGTPADHADDQTSDHVSTNETTQETRARLGNNRNQFFGNDFSYSAAHGLELTFSFDNTITHNTFTENAICGIWAGFSQDTSISHNNFDRNGDRGYGLERGGINIEHGSHNRIIANRFVSNTCGVHLWWDEPGSLAELPWYSLNYQGVRANTIQANAFRAGDVGIQLGDQSIELGQPVRMTDTRIAASTFVGVNTNEDIAPAITIQREPNAQLTRTIPQRTSGQTPRMLPGRSRPVGARPQLAGRHQILMTEWFPWDHTSPMVVPTPKDASATSHEYLIYSRTPMWFAPAIVQRLHSGVGVRIEPMPNDRGSPELSVARVTIDTVRGEGLVPYDVRVSHRDEAFDLVGRFVRVP